MHGEAGPGTTHLMVWEGLLPAWHLEQAAHRANGS